ncbi:tetratricopeptide repeat protein [Sphingobacterium haloxyli]|uniref:Tetratricopeptide repeat protein n=1 Tax=Sphingobacterium haloxyli TaxID=2100533 RepID=A0A2S9J532_9SPHI|nr:tetratricopeptide repeat protein [Sphingobacterium haloxyli]PRD47893.1 tetratricopeptide repeat protein [Sphingobacterium haloxyli]
MRNRLEELQEFLKDSPNDPFLKYAITMEYKKLGDNENTLAGFQDLRANHPDYVGTYYHFAKFLEEQGRKEEALETYNLGMEVAQRLRNRHAYNELLAAYNLAMGIADEDWDD